MDDTDYQDCCYFDGSCGKERNDNSCLVQATELDAEIDGHLRALKISPDDFPLMYSTEKKLVENRAGKSMRDCDKICPYHRQNHGLGWRQSKKCKHPDHLGKSSSMRTLNFKQLNYYTNLGVKLTIGSAFCSLHRKGN